MCTRGDLYYKKIGLSNTTLCWLQEEHAELTLSAQISKTMKLFDNLQLFVDIQSDQAVECKENGRNTFVFQKSFSCLETPKNCAQELNLSHNWTDTNAPESSEPNQNTFAWRRNRNVQADFNRGMNTSEFQPIDQWSSLEENYKASNPTAINQRCRV
jgi:hypothetical protein